MALITVDISIDVLKVFFAPFISKTDFFERKRPNMMSCFKCPIVFFDAALCSLRMLVVFAKRIQAKGITFVARQRRYFKNHQTRLAKALEIPRNSAKKNPKTHDNHYKTKHTHTPLPKEKEKKSLEKPKTTFKKRKDQKN